MKLNKRPDPLSDQGNPIIDTPIVKKEFINKKGVGTGVFEYYAQRSIQDYFIKFCESKISKKELEQALEAEKGLLKTVRLEVEYKEGNWDQCGKELVQSRTGSYIIIHSIK